MVACVCASSAIATTQERDLIILEGDRIYTYDLPNLKEAFPDIEFPEFGFLSTSCWKGYRGTWATFQKQLYLVGLEAIVEDTFAHNSEITPKYKFPLKVNTWSGKITRTEESYPIELDPKKSRKEITTTIITIKNGTVVDVNINTESKFDKDSEPES